MYSAADMVNAVIEFGLLVNDKNALVCTGLADFPGSPRSVAHWGGKLVLPQDLLVIRVPGV